MLDQNKNQVVEPRELAAAFLLFCESSFEGKLIHAMQAFGEAEDATSKIHYQGLQ